MKQASRALSWAVLTLLALAAPAAAIAYDAQNAHTVDGKHAVAAGASRAARSGKLVATNAQGYLPNNIIRVAPNSAKLGGKPKSFFAPASHLHKGVPYADVVIVAKSGGNFTSVQAALDAVSGSSSAPVLIWVAPGRYADDITMESFVDLQGAGPNMTRLVPASATQMVVLRLAGGSTVSDLGIENTTPDLDIRTVGALPGVSEMRNVSILAEASGALNPTAYALTTFGPDTHVSLHDVSITLRHAGFGQAAAAQVINEGTLEVFNSRISAESFGGTETHVQGIYNGGGTLEVTGSDVAAISSLGVGIGITTGQGGGAPTSPLSTIHNSTVTGIGTSQSRSLLLHGLNPEVRVSGSILVSSASFKPVIQSEVTGSSTIRVATSQLDGGNVHTNLGPASYKCVYSYDESLNPVDAGCVSVP